MPNPGEDEAVAGTSLAYLPSGLKMQKPLNREENANWKKFKRSLENYAIVARINLFEEEFKMAMFLSAIGQDAMKIYEGTYFEPEANSKDLDDVIRKFANFSVHKTNETYKRFNFKGGLRSKSKISLKIPHYNVEPANIHSTKRFFKILI